MRYFIKGDLKIVLEPTGKWTCKKLPSLAKVYNALSKIEYDQAVVSDGDPQAKVFEYVVGRANPDTVVNEPPQETEEKGIVY